MLSKFFVAFMCVAIIAGVSEGFVKSKPRIGRKIANTLKLTSEQSLVVQYFRCFENNKELSPIKKCVEPLLSTNISESEKNRFTSWLFVYPFQLSDFAECTKRKLDEIRFFPLATDIFVCAQIEMASQKKQAVFFFEKDAKDKLRMKSIYY